MLERCLERIISVDAKKSGDKHPIYLRRHGRMFRGVANFEKSVTTDRESFGDIDRQVYVGKV